MHHYEYSHPGSAPGLARGGHPSAPPRHSMTNRSSIDQIPQPAVHNHHYYGGTNGPMQTVHYSQGTYGLTEVTALGSTPPVTISPSNMVAILLRQLPTGAHARLVWTKTVQACDDSGRLQATSLNWWELILWGRTSRLLHTNKMLQDFKENFEGVHAPQVEAQFDLDNDTAGKAKTYAPGIRNGLPTSPLGLRIQVAPCHLLIVEIDAKRPIAENKRSVLYKQEDQKSNAWPKFLSDKSSLSNLKDSDDYLNSGLDKDAATPSVKIFYQRGDKVYDLDMTVSMSSYRNPFSAALSLIVQEIGDSAWETDIMGALTRHANGNQAACDLYTGNDIRCETGPPPRAFGAEARPDSAPAVEARERYLGLADRANSFRILERTCASNEVPSRGLLRDLVASLKHIATGHGDTLVRRIRPHSIMSATTLEDTPPSQRTPDGEETEGTVWLVRWLHSPRDYGSRICARAI